MVDAAVTVVANGGGCWGVVGVSTVSTGLRLSLTKVWLLTQFHSVDFSNSRISAKVVILQSRSAPVVFGAVVGPPRLTRHTGQFPSFYGVPDAT